MRWLWVCLLLGCPPREAPAPTKEATTKEVKKNQATTMQGAILIECTPPMVPVNDPIHPGCRQP